MRFEHKWVRNFMSSFDVDFWDVKKIKKKKIRTQSIMHMGDSFFINLSKNYVKVLLVENDEAY